MGFVRRLRQLSVAVAALLAATPVMANEFELLKLDRAYLKWGSPAFGTGAEVSYSFVREQIDFPKARNCRSMVSPAAMAEKSGMTFETFGAIVREAFAQWEAAADVHFRYVEDPATADILIGAQARPVGIAFANVVPSKVSVWRGGKEAVASLKQAMICFNPTLAWSAGQGGQGRDLFLVAGHEIGHTLGLDHPGPRGTRMAFKEGFVSRNLEASDIQAVQTLYGRKP